MEKDSALRIAHLSDPHFSRISYHPRQFLSKRWIGNFNLMFFRQHRYQTEHLLHLPELVDSLKVEAVFITGDFSATSLDEEFSEGKKFASDFKEKGLCTFVVPGNHDCYTKAIEQGKRFYSFFPSNDLRDKRVESFSLGKRWWYIGLDCAVATPPFCSYGIFLESTEKHLKEALLAIPHEDCVVVANHFPLFTTGRPLHDLRRAQELQNVLQAFGQVKLYLHGHDHEHHIADRQSEGFPLVLNCGSCAHRPGGTFYLIDLFEKECLVQRLVYQKEGNAPFSWDTVWQKHYTWRT
jgi:3',5'-cyclic AMP phosphodiesterase CpdA